MTSLDFNAMNQQAKDQLAVTLAALILHEDKTDVNGEAINRILKAANVNVAPYWPMLFAKAVEGKNLGDFLTVGSGSSGPVVQNTATTTTGKAPAVEEKQAAPKEEPEEVDMDMGDLFG